ncbi:MAG: type transport system permease protein, partial [Streptomycetaceae bacterium]|nr:type transport system permease protein [Streptomycetaceae bacterium]
MTAPVPTPYAPQQPPLQQPPEGPWYGAYASPIPVQNTNLGHALASEWTKIRTVRSTIWTLGVMLFLVLGINLLVDWAYTAHGPTVSDPVLSPGLFGVMFGQLAVITLGVLVITSEYSTGMMRTTFTACPQRARVLTAKAIVFFGLTFTVTTIACTVTALINRAVIGGQSVSVNDYTGSGVTVRDGVTTASASQWLGATVGVGLYIALLGLLGLAVGTLLRHSAGAITAMIGVVLLPLLIAIFMQSEQLRTVQEKMVEYSSPNALASLYRIPILGSDHANGMSQLTGLAVVTGVALAAAYAVLARRDV